MRRFDREEAERLLRRLESDDVLDDDTHLEAGPMLGAALREIARLEDKAQEYLTVLDGTAPYGDWPIGRQIDRLTRRAQAAEIERDAMRPVVDACVREAELNDACMGDHDIDDAVLEELEQACRDEWEAIDHYRKTADARDIEVVRLRADAPR